MLYAILCYNDEDLVWNWSKEEEDTAMAGLAAVQAPLADKGKLGPVARLMPTSAATTLRKNGKESFVVDGPFAETKEQFLGFYVVDVENLDEAITISKDLAAANPGTGSYEIRPLALYNPPRNFG
ncbi:YciI family protein [Rhizobium sp. KVB221]|uniref:YciI family protein n=1 Tax=Rhizobium setariae TaxID=2801340 RepID=A0A936YKN7_9HYPH|nr:YciI family protein [Rhizobium setariae]MBL0372085.1 YciI family protein [Rhizobium setariae]